MNSRRVICLPAGAMFYPPSRNGNMPAGRERPPHTHGVIVSPARMRIIMPADIRRPVMWGCMRPTRGAFLDMHGMWDGPRTGTNYPTGNPVVDPWTGIGLVGSYGVVPGSSLRSLSASAPPVPATTPLASVSVSNPKARKVLAFGGASRNISSDRSFSPIIVIASASFTKLCHREG